MVIINRWSSSKVSSYDRLYCIWSKEPQYTGMLSVLILPHFTFKFSMGFNVSLTVDYATLLVVPLLHCIGSFVLHI